MGPSADGAGVAATVFGTSVAHSPTYSAIRTPIAATASDDHDQLGRCVVPATVLPRHPMPPVRRPCRPILIPRSSEKQCLRERILAIRSQKSSVVRTACAVRSRPSRPRGTTRIRSALGLHEHRSARTRPREAHARRPGEEVERGLGARRHLRLRPLRAARAHLRDRHAAADRQRLAARRARLLLHPHRRGRPLPADARARGLLPDGLGRQRAADRAPRAEPLRRALRPRGRLRPRLRAARRRPPRRNRSRSRGRTSSSCACG